MARRYKVLANDAEGPGCPKCGGCQEWDQRYHGWRCNECKYFEHIPDKWDLADMKYADRKDNS